ncbi:MAG: YicC family protein [Candidatus Omnitrophica bacterium]|jgi:uncharacterized protein (TIGR00255 family)|nr:YicC family protein [Candidatus Omnitrophota bacterium]
MIQGMTGFGFSLVKVKNGKISVQIRSTNHKFREVALHLSEGHLGLEEAIREQIENRIRRGRISCAIDIQIKYPQDVSVNSQLLKKYSFALRQIQRDFSTSENISLDTLIRLPGVLSLKETGQDKEALLPHVRNALSGALDDLLRMRHKEGTALEKILRKMANKLLIDVALVKQRFARSSKLKLAVLKSDEEKSAFLRNSDITEEMDRLTFHAKSFLQKLAKNNSVGKELDFIAQEMQREANTMAAKSCDKMVSSRAVQIKSLIEKIREQAQNVD